MSIRGPKLKYFAGVLAIIAIITGIYLTFFHSRGFVKTDAVIVSLEQTTGGADEDDMYLPTVEYTVDGKTYTGTLDVASGSYKVGKTIKVMYDPADPSVVHSGGGFGLYVLFTGVAILGVIIVSSVLEKKSQKQIKEHHEKSGWKGYMPSVQGPERELYFLTDLGTPKYGHRLEDKNRAVRYEAKMTKFSLIQPFAFDFIDHEHGTVTPHLIGHTEESQWDTLLIDNHYTVELDGVDIWKHLRDNGISVESSYRGGGNGPLIGTEYHISRDGKEIAYAKLTSQYPHEEDAKEHNIASAIPVSGFYQVWTREENLDLLFMTLVAFARSGANDDQGGNYGAIMGTLKKLGKEE